MSTLKLLTFMGILSISFAPSASASVTQSEWNSAFKICPQLKPPSAEIYRIAVLMVDAKDNQKVATSSQKEIQRMMDAAELAYEKIRTICLNSLKAKQ